MPASVRRTLCPDADACAPSLQQEEQKVIEAKLQARKAELERQVCIFRPLLSFTGLFCRALLVPLRSGAQYEHSCYYPMSSRQERTQLRALPRARASSSSGCTQARPRRRRAEREAGHAPRAE